MKRISPAERCVYIHIIPIPGRRFDLPTEFELLLDGQPVRKLYRLYGGIASQRIELTGLSHTVTLRGKDGTVLQQAAIPAAPYNYLCAMEEERGFAISTFGPMRPTADCEDFEKLARLLSAKLIRLLTPDSPICMLYQQLKEREIDHLWFEFWETAMIVHYMPKSGHVPDLKFNFDTTESYKAVIGDSQLTLRQTLMLERQVTVALADHAEANGMVSYYNDAGFFCLKLK